MSDPTDFPVFLSSNGTFAELKELTEICQGGPIIGKLFINKKPILSDSWFCGPMFIRGENLFLTMRHRKFLFNGFKLCRVNLISNEIFHLNVKSDLLWITQVSDNAVSYKTSFESQEKESRVFFSL